MFSLSIIFLFISLSADESGYTQVRSASVSVLDFDNYWNDFNKSSMVNVNIRQQCLVHQIQQPPQIFLQQSSSSSNSYNNYNNYNNSQYLSQQRMGSNEQVLPG